MHLFSCHIMDIIYGQFLVCKQISSFFTDRCASTYDLYLCEQLTMLHFVLFSTIANNDSLASIAKKFLFIVCYIQPYYR